MERGLERNWDSLEASTVDQRMPGLCFRLCETILQSSCESENLQE